MALQCYNMEEFGNESLEEWESIGSGGFGHVYKARHKDWGFDVAIKILKDKDGVCPATPKEKALHEEASNMEKASCEFVLRVRGFYQGCPPLPGIKNMQRGIVMQFMRGGSVQSMLTVLHGPPPYSLAFRLAHQVALGMNFLHLKKILHLDLKPSNVLLNEGLNAKIADFGLSRVQDSIGETTTEIGGSYKYKPPEAFNDSYDPACAFDVYSYGILLWSIITGEEPYDGAVSSLVELHIPEGKRPDCTGIDVTKADGLKEMADLMKKCWDGNPSQRPSFKECREVTEKVFSKHEEGINTVVDEVLRKLKSQASNQHSETSVASSRPLQTQEQSKPYDIVDHVRFTEIQRSSTQVSASVSIKGMSDKDKEKFVDDNMADLIQDVSEVMPITEALGKMVHRETYDLIAVTATSQDKMRLLYRKTFRSGGRKVKAAFYDALKEHHAELVERLGG